VGIIVFAARMSPNHSERTRRETNFKINSLQRLIEALDTVEKVFGRALDQFKGKNGQKSSPLTRDIIEPRSLGIHFTYFKDYPLSVSTHILQRIQAKSKSELSALKKKKEWLKEFQGAILTKQDDNWQSNKDQGTLPKIEEGCLCTPKIGLVKVLRQENGLFGLTEEYTYFGEQAVKSDSGWSPGLSHEDETHKHECVYHTTNKVPDKCSINAASKLQNGSRDYEGEQLYADIIDLNVMEKLNGMDAKARGDYTAQFYEELFQENDWLLPAKRKDNASKKLHSFENEAQSIEQSITSSRDAARKRNRGFDKYNSQCSDLARLFSGKKKDRNNIRERKLQTQRVAQCQDYPENQLISKNEKNKVLRRKQRTQQEPQNVTERYCTLHKNARAFRSEEE